MVDSLALIDDSRLALIDRTLPIELIIACYDAALAEYSTAIDKMDAMEDRQRALMDRRSICRRYRALFPQPDEYIISARGQLVRLKHVMVVDTERASMARRLIIAYYENGVGPSDTIGLLSSLPDLEVLAILPPTSLQLMVALSNLKRLEKVDLNINNFDENGLAQ